MSFPPLSFTPHTSSSEEPEVRKNKSFFSSLLFRSVTSDSRFPKKKECRRLGAKMSFFVGMPFSLAPPPLSQPRPETQCRKKALRHIEYQAKIKQQKKIKSTGSKTRWHLRRSGKLRRTWAYFSTCSKVQGLEWWLCKKPIMSCVFSRKMGTLRNR